MSHEICTPMNAIIGLSRLLQRENVTASQAGQLTRINTFVEHLLTIINDITRIKLEST